MFIALNLIALALGYKVFVEATREKKDLKTLGRAVGIFIMIIAFTMTTFSVVKLSKAWCASKSKSGCPFRSFKFCPYASGSAKSDGPSK